MTGVGIVAQQNQRSGTQSRGFSTGLLSTFLILDFERGSSHCIDCDTCEAHLPFARNFFMQNGSRPSKFPSS